MMDTISLKTREHELYNITDEVKKSVENSGVKDGLCLVYTPHSTAGVLIACGIDPDAFYPEGGADGNAFCAYL